MKRIRPKHLITVISVVTLVFIATIMYARSEISAQVTNPQIKITQPTDTYTSSQQSRMVMLASQDVSVTVTVLPNLSLSIIEGEPKYATNWPYGATLSVNKADYPTIYWTVTADF